MEYCKDIYVLWTSQAIFAVLSRGCHRRPAFGSHAHELCQDCQPGIPAVHLPWGLVDEERNSAICRIGASGHEKIARLAMNVAVLIRQFFLQAGVQNLLLVQSGGLQNL